MSIFGDQVQLINAQATTSTGAREVLLVVVMSSTQSRVQELEQSSLSISNTEELKSKLNYLKVIGYGQLFGCSQHIMLMDNGQHLERSTLLSQEEMMLHAPLVAETNSDRLSIGDHIGQLMLGIKVMLNILIHQISQTISTFMVLSGLKTTSLLRSMEQKC